MKKCNYKCFNSRAGLKKLTFTALITAVSIYAKAQANGNAGITEATTQVKSYFDTGTDLMYAIGAIVGLMGAVKV